MCEQERHWLCVGFLLCFCVRVFVCYHGLDDVVNGLCMYGGSALAQIHNLVVPPVDGCRSAGDVRQHVLFHVLRRRYDKDLHMLARFLRNRFDFIARFAGYVAVRDDNSESEDVGVCG